MSEKPVLYKIGEVSKILDTTIRTIRFYEERGIISPRRKNSHRLYAKRDIVRLKLAIRGRHLGFTIEEISDLINTYDRSVESNRYQAIKMLEICDKHIMQLDKKMESIANLKQELHRVKQQMLKFLIQLEKKRK